MSKFEHTEADAAGLELHLKQPDGSYEKVTADKATEAFKRRAAKQVVAKRNTHSIMAKLAKTVAKAKGAK